MESPFSHGLARVELRHLVAGVPQLNVFHVRDTHGGAGRDDYQRVANAFGKWWVDGYPPHVAGVGWAGSDATLAEVAVAVALDLAEGFVSTLFGDLFGGLFGFNGPSLPPNCTKAIEWTTATRGKHGHGRTYICGLAEQFRDPAHPERLDPFTAPPLLATYRDLIRAVDEASFPNGRFELVVWHRSPIVTEPGVLRWASRIGDCRFSSLVLDSQRGRLPRHRR